jgi:hypothetical protein
MVLMIENGTNAERELQARDHMLEGPGKITRDDFHERIKTGNVHVQEGVMRPLMVGGNRVFILPTTCQPSINWTA